MPETVVHHDDYVCRECGLVLGDSPRRVWNGHEHKPIAKREIRAAATVYAVALEMDSEIRARVGELIAASGISQQAVDMYLDREAQDG